MLFKIHTSEKLLRSIKRVWYVVFLSFFFSFSHWNLKSQESVHSFPFLNLPATPQAQAVGGYLLTYVGVNPGLALDNPALYGQESAGRMYLSYMNYMQGVHVANALYGSGIGDRATWAIGIRAMNYGKMEGYDTQGMPTGSFSPMDASLQALFSYDLTERLRGGIALKAIYGQLERYSSFALASDLGLSYYHPDKGMSWAISLSNIGGFLKNYGEPRDIPDWDIRLGYSQKFMHAPFRLHGVLYGLTPHHIREVGNGEPLAKRFVRHLALGAEMTLSDNFWIALGYNPHRAMNMSMRNGKSIHGFSMGVGFNQKHYQVALSAALYHQQTMGIMLSISTDFGSGNYLF